MAFGQNFKDGLSNFIASNISAQTDNLTTMAMGVLKFSEADLDLITSIVNAGIGSVCMVLAAIYLFSGMVEDAINGKDIEIMDIVKPIVTLIIADLLLTHSKEIVAYVMGISNYLSDQVYGLVTGNQATADQYLQNGTTSLAKSVTDKKTIGELLVLTITTTIGRIVSAIASVVLYMTCFTAKIELMIRLAFVPIGFAGFASPSQKHESIRYLKKLLAASFYCMAMLAVLVIATQEANIVQSSMNAGDTTFGVGLNSLIAAIYMAATPFAAVGALSLAKSAVNEAFGS